MKTKVIDELDKYLTPPIPDRKRIDRLMRIIGAALKAAGQNIAMRLVADGPGGFHEAKKNEKFDKDNLPRIELADYVVQWDTDTETWGIFVTVCHPGIHHRRDGSGDPDEYEDMELHRYSDTDHFTIARMVVAEHIIAEALNVAFENFQEQEMSETQCTACGGSLTQQRHCYDPACKYHNRRCPKNRRAV